MDSDSLLGCIIIVLTWTYRSYLLVSHHRAEQREKSSCIFMRFMCLMSVIGDVRLLPSLQPAVLPGK